MNIKNVVSTIVRYCKVTYRLCEAFEDLSYKGFISLQRIVFEDWSPMKLTAYFVSGFKSQSKGIFSPENVFGVMGVGRLDGDEKYTHNTREELVSAYALESSNVVLHLERSASAVFGRLMNYAAILNFSMLPLEVSNTRKHSLDAVAIALVSSGQPTLLNLASDLSFELCINRKKNTLPLSVQTDLVEKTVYAIRQSSFAGLLLDNNKTHIGLRATQQEIKQLHATIQLQFSLGKDLAITDANLFILTHRCGSLAAKCDFEFSFEAGSSPLLGNAFLHRRVIDIRNEVLLMSNTTVGKEDFWNIHTSYDSSSGKMTFTLVMFCCSLVMMYKSCEGCSKTLIQDK